MRWSVISPSLFVMPWKRPCPTCGRGEARRCAACNTRAGMPPIFAGNCDESSHLLLDHAGAHVVLDQPPDVIDIAHELGGALDRERARTRQLDRDALAQ